MNQVIMSAYVDEFEKIAAVDKQAFLGKILPFLGKGLKQWGALGRSVGKRGFGGTAKALREAARTHGKRMWKPGVKGMKASSSGYWELAKHFAPAGAVAGIGGLGLYGGGKLLSGRRERAPE